MGDETEAVNHPESKAECPHDFRLWVDEQLLCRLCRAVFDDVFNEQVNQRELDGG